VLVAISALSGSALGQSPSRPDTDARARAHYEIGEGLFQLGKYSEAVKEFAAGYQLTRRPRFLLDLAQAYRQLGDEASARQMLEQFLAEAPADDIERPQVTELLGQLRGSPGPAPLAARPLLPAAQPSTLAVHAEVSRRAVESTSPRRAKPYWWIGVAGGALVVGAALGVGIYFGTKPRVLSCDAAEAGCLDLRR
jgi:FimV-like protein